ncbi:hypothetical protein BV25DRAFT_1873004 [Artomyces pyxidatus]|uniref:Uncharacterized protein n=1 Tax=Artomyces pyxidatus TaxID=48021 RepID=A0ACB8SIX1_9AGAM|nr:hypothetical protein BV25DRAFT_1873004 [Artomyces pyxidatus]
MFATSDYRTTKVATGIALVACAAIFCWCYQRVENRIVSRVLDRVSKGYILRRDFALAATGARILPALTSTSQIGVFMTLLGLFRSNTSRQPPEAILMDSVHPGDCWSFSGNSAHVGIVLAEPIFITHVSIDHIPKLFTSNIGTAPRNMILWGLVEGQRDADTLRDLSADAPPLASGWNSKFNSSASYLRSGRRFVAVSAFTYDVEASFHIQTFDVWDGPRKHGVEFGVVVLEVVSNWGEVATCLYRVRIHGERV